MLARERPDALLPTLGGQTALNLARELHESGILDELGIELIGADDRRDPRGPRTASSSSDAVESCGLAGADVAHRHRRSTISTGSRCPRSSARRSRSAATAAASPTRRSELRAPVERGLSRVPDRPGARRGVGARLGRVRARGRARPRRQRRDRLLDREPRSDGRPHGRLGHRRAADDAQRRGLPGAPRRGDRDHPRGRRRHGGSNIQFARDREHRRASA